ncbi:MAG: GH3 auxin-responsive promoter family protein [Bacteroidota bacterium]
MGIKSFAVKPIAKRVAKQIAVGASNAVLHQEKILQYLIKEARQTQFGKDHNFQSIKTHEDFTKAVPLRDYEGLKSYVEQIKNGQSDVLWKGLPRYFAKTSGTTSGVKYIPITKDSIPNHISGARNALFSNVAFTNTAKLFDGKVIFLSGSPELEKVGGILTGRLSGIVNHLIPAWLKGNQLPSWETNLIDDWERKLDAIVKETIDQDMRLISGIPPWVQMYYERLLEVSGKQYVREIFPNFSTFVHGGVNYEPYKSKLESLVGKSILNIETYPASEGFIAFQDRPDAEGLLLNSNSGICFEFVPADEVFNEAPTRLMLSQIELGVNYAVIINSNAGLWGYNIGDTVEFVSKDPYRLKVTGRIKHFISAFGEHVIGKEVEEAMLKTAQHFNAEVVEFTVAPQVQAKEGLPYHEWFVEFGEVPSNKRAFAKMLDEELQRQNIYYKDLLDGQILKTLELRVMQKDAFRNYMKSIGKLGGQNKVPRLSNDRKIADQLKEFIAK